MALSLLGCLPPSAKCQVPISAKKLLRFSPAQGKVRLATINWQFSLYARLSDYSLT